MKNINGSTCVLNIYTHYERQSNIYYYTYISRYIHIQRGVIKTKTIKKTIKVSSYFLCEIYILYLVNVMRGSWFTLTTTKFMKT